jgi:hypothetical protein
MGYACRGPNYHWYWPWESWLDPKPADPATWNVFGPAGMAMLPIWLGVPVLGGAFAAALVAPKLIQKEIEPKKAYGAFFGLMALLIVAGLLSKHLTGLQGMWLVFFSYLAFYFGFVMPQRHIRQLDWTRYLVTMFLVVSTVGVLLKMGARLAFHIKYLLTIPAVNMNI